jgi:hypothetical protein
MNGARCRTPYLPAIDDPPPVALGRATGRLATGSIQRGRVEATITLVPLAVLLSVGIRFGARSDPCTRWFALVMYAQFAAVAIGYGLGLLYFSGRTIGYGPGRAVAGSDAPRPRR